MSAKDLFSDPDSSKAGSYTAKDIEVLEGLEPVRKRPGMYIGGTDENALHHLVSEIFDNSMDEAVAGHANEIRVEMHRDGSLSISDNGRGIPVDPHPKFKNKSALEVILTMLHSGGKFGGKAYKTAGGLHGVGISVVNALTERLEVEVYRNGECFRQSYSRGVPKTKLLKEKASSAKQRGTKVTFLPDPEIFGDKARLKPSRVYHFVKSKAYLFKGVTILWKCPAEMVTGGVPEQDKIHFPEGLTDYLAYEMHGKPTVTAQSFSGEVELDGENNLGKVEWAIHWPQDGEGFLHSYCNTIPTAQGGTHESGFKAALYKGLREYGATTNNKRAGQITAEDVVSESAALLSVFVHEPQFQGQTKEKLVNAEVARQVENILRDRFDLWLGNNPDAANTLLEHTIRIAEDRMRRRQEKDVSRKSLVKKLRLPGKLADCTQETSGGAELYLVEGDSAGGSAKQARNREHQAVLPLRGKILNVANASGEKISNNQEINDMLLALGCGAGNSYNEENLRYEKVIIMTDADVDGAHIASLLMTFFYREMPDLIFNGHLYLAQPPLYRLTQGDKNVYAKDDAAKARLIAELQKTSRKQIDIGRFKGLGEMTAKQLKETTMDPKTRTLLKVVIESDERGAADQRVSELMGKNPEFRFKFIQEQTELRKDRMTEQVDV